MAWIESHQELAEHPKLFHLASLSGLSTDACIGRLHRLWWWCLKFAEDGDLSRYQSVQIPPIETDEFREHLRTSKWLDGDLIHDWIDYAGLFLTKKYNTGNIQRLKQIWQKHGYKYGKGKGKFTKQEVSKQRIERELKVNIPLPNLTNLTKPEEKEAQSEFEKFWDVYPNKVGKKDAQRAWEKAKDKPPLVDILQAVESARKSLKWTQENGRFIPNPSTWLNQGRWTDVHVVGGLSPPVKLAAIPPFPGPEDPIGRSLWRKSYGHLATQSK